METNNEEMKNELKNLAGDFEALGLDLFDILKMARNLKMCEKEINDLKKALENALKTRDEMLKKLDIQAEEK